MTLAMQRAGLQPQDVDYIAAHATSTSVGDMAETDAIKMAFGDHAYKLAASANKSMLGHLLGAAGGVSAIACVYRDPGWHRSADHQPDRPGSPVRPRLCAKRRPQDAGRCCPGQRLRLWRPERGCRLQAVRMRGRSQEFAQHSWALRDPQLLAPAPQISPQLPFVAKVTPGLPSPLSPASILPNWHVFGRFGIDRGAQKLVPGNPN